MGLYSRKLRYEKRTYDDSRIRELDTPENAAKFALFLTVYFSILLIAEKLVQCA